VQARLAAAHIAPLPVSLRYLDVEPPLATSPPWPAVGRSSRRVPRSVRQSLVGRHSVQRWRKRLHAHSRRRRGAHGAGMSLDGGPATSLRTCRTIRAEMPATRPFTAGDGRMSSRPRAR